MSPLVSAARTYLRAPFGHRGRTGRRLDCAGLVIRAYADNGVVLPDVRHYGREPLDDSLSKYAEGALGAPLPKGTRLQPGDVVLIRYEGLPHHVALVGDYPLKRGELTIIHADSREMRVVEHRLTDECITHAFRRPV